MNKKTVFLTVGIVLLIVLAVTYALLSPRKDTVRDQMTPDSQTKPVTVDSAPSDQISKRDGMYTDYSSSKLLATTGTKLLFFHAPWCPQCRAIEESIMNEGLPSGVTVFKIDYDSNQKLRQQYDVTIQTTFVKVDDDGNKITSYVAYQEPQFSSVERELLK